MAGGTIDGKLCRELKHVNVIDMVESILENKCIHLVFEYAEHDLLVGRISVVALTRRSK